MGNAVVLQLVELVVVQDKSVWLPVDVHHLHRPWLVLVVELLEELAVLLRLYVLDLLDVLHIFLVVVKHRVQRVLHVVHEPAVKDCSAVFFVPLPETWVLVELSKYFIQSRYVG
jgi:hypothetical protein